MLLVVLSLLALLAQDAACLKILMYSPRFGPSHIMFVGKLADQLAEAGHEVVLYQPILNLAVKDVVGAKHARFIERYPSYDLLDKMDVGPTIWSPVKESLFSPPSILQILRIMGDTFKTSCEDQLLDTEMMNRLKMEKFDIGLSEFFDICGHGIFKRIGVEKTIILYASAMPTQDLTYFGLPNSVAFVHDIFNFVSLSDFKGRFFNYIAFLFNRFALTRLFVGRTAEAFKVFDENLDYQELIANSSYCFVNMDEHLDIPRPITHKYINIAGVGMQKALKSVGSLNKKYQNAFDSAKKGVLYFSLGSVASSFSMPNEAKQAFLDAFAEFPEINFLWKYEKPEHNIAKDHPNVFTDTWLPQKEIMGHKKLLGFITHGGANSITEASYAGVPLIAIPLFGDQDRNAFMIELRGIGVQINKYSLTKENIVNAIRKIVYKPSYMQKSRELSEIIRNKPTNPDDRFVKHVEFAAKYNVHDALDMSGRKLSTIEYYNLDVIAICFTTTFTILFIIYYLFRILFRYMTTKPKTHKTE